MSEAARAPLLEMRLHKLLPGPFWFNGLIIAVATFASYLGWSVVVGQAIIITDAQGRVALAEFAWAAFVLSLIFAAALTLPAWGAAQWEEAEAEIITTLAPEGAAGARVITIGPPRSQGLGAALWFAIGFVGGVALVAWEAVRADRSFPEYMQTVGGWYAVMAPILIGLGARAARLLSAEDRELAVIVHDHLEVDLARLDRLRVYGRLALRGAAVWLVMAAIIGLSFVDAAPAFITFGTFALALAAAVYDFTSTLQPVVRKTVAAKDAALGAVRAEITAIAARLIDTQSADGELSELDARMSALTAYEAWLERRPVWPISAPVTRRLALYGFIPVLAWFGAAAAELILAGLT